jgi:ribosome-binding protein aMBF1 (putative translation factor)
LTFFSFVTISGWKRTSNGSDVRKNMHGGIHIMSELNGSKVTRDVKNRYRALVLERRLKAGISKQKTLAEMSGIPRSILSDLESGKTFLSSAYALRLAEVLDCSIDDLYVPRRVTKSDGRKDEH